jgi:hypothetical protein
VKSRDVSISLPFISIIVAKRAEYTAEKFNKCGPDKEKRDKPDHKFNSEQNQPGDAQVFIGSFSAGCGDDDGINESDDGDCHQEEE